MVLFDRCNWVAWKNILTLLFSIRNFQCTRFSSSTKPQATLLLPLFVVWLWRDWFTTYFASLRYWNIAPLVPCPFLWENRYWRPRDTQFRARYLASYNIWTRLMQYVDSSSIVQSFQEFPTTIFLEFTMGLEGNIVQSEVTKFILANQLRAFFVETVSSRTDSDRLNNTWK